MSRAKCAAFKTANPKSVLPFSLPARADSASSPVLNALERLPRALLMRQVRRRMRLVYLHKRSPPPRWPRSAQTPLHPPARPCRSVRSAIHCQCHHFSHPPFLPYPWEDGSPTQPPRQHDARARAEPSGVGWQRKPVIVAPPAAWRRVSAAVGSGNCWGQCSKVPPARKYEYRHWNVSCPHGQTLHAQPSRSSLRHQAA